MRLQARSSENIETNPSSQYLPPIYMFTEIGLDGGIMIVIMIVRWSKNMFMEGNITVKLFKAITYI